jgi:hypothetical protein
MRINIQKYRQQFRPENPEDLTPAELQGFLIFLIGDAAALDHLWQNTPHGVLQNERVYQQIGAEIHRYQERLQSYLVAVNGAIAQDMGDSSHLGAWVSRPLFLGLFRKGYKRLDGPPPTCPDPEDCYESVPDFLHPAIIRNQLAEWNDLSEEHWQRFLDDLQENTKHVVTYTVKPVWDTLKDIKNASSSKWFLYGILGTIGAIGLYTIARKK